MSRDMFEQISRAARAQYLAEFETIRGILAEEADVRSRLARLAARSRAGGGTGPDNFGMQTVGADILWQGWKTRTHRQLNMELAQVMARKLAAMDRVRRAFGRCEAIRRLLETHSADAARKAAARDHERLSMWR